MPLTYTSAPIPLVVYGAAGHAKVVLDIVRRQGAYRIVGVLDRYKAAGTACGCREVAGTMDDLPGLYRAHGRLAVIVAVGDNWARGRITVEIAGLCPGIEFGTAVHPSAQIGCDVRIGGWTVIMAGAVVNPAAVVGEGCVINTGATLDHDCVMGAFSSLGPAAAIGGAVRIGAYTSIGIGAAVIQEMTIGERTVVGAGAVVVRPIPDSVVAYGVPARVMRTRQAGERYLGGVTAGSRK